jgi:hypothetical protein
VKSLGYFSASFLLLALYGPSALGQQRTFVSGLGNDANPCNRAAPCRTFTQALSMTNAGGEVVVLDSAGYGAFAITQAVTVQAPPGVYAGISVFSGDGITISAGGTDTVILRGLTVNNQGSNGDGIAFNTGGTLHVENCVVSGFASGRGLLIGGAGTLEVKDSIVRSSGVGIQATASSGTAAASIDHVRLEGNNVGIFAEDRAKVTVTNSLASNNGTGFEALSNSLAVELNIDTCVVTSSSNFGGIFASSMSNGVATVRVSNSTVTGNTVGLFKQGSAAVLLSRGDNTVEGNGTDTIGTIGSYTAK